MGEFEIRNGALLYCLRYAVEDVIPDGVEEIAKNAFGGTYIRKIKLPPSVKTIGVAAFEYCRRLEQIDLSEGLETIKEYAFRGCISLKSLTIPDSVKSVDRRAFKGCGSLTEVTFPGAIPNSLQFLHECPIKVIYAPKASVTRLPSHKREYLKGFMQLLKEGVGFEDKIIEKNYEYIKRNARGLCSEKDEDLFLFMLKNKLIPLKDVDPLVEKFNKEKDLARVATLIDYKDKNFTEEQKDRQFNKQFEIKEPSLAELKRDWKFSEKEDGTYRITAYKGENTEIVVPSVIKGVKVTEVGKGKSGFDGRSLFFKNAFRSKVTSVTLQEGIEIIAACAFSHCDSLAYVNIPGSVKEIGNEAFAFCKSLAGIALPEGLRTIYPQVFAYCLSLKSISIPATVAEMWFGQFIWCVSLNQVSLSEGLDCVPSYSFYNCKSLKTVAIPGSVKKILSNAFYGCESLEEIYLPEGVESICDDAFRDCKSLKRVTIPTTVREISGGAFIGCPNLTLLCLGKDPPGSWDRFWDLVSPYGKKAKVIWGYKDDNK